MSGYKARAVPFLIAFLVMSAGMFAQTGKYRIAGSIQDSATGELLPLVRVYLAETNYGSNSNLDGNFELYAPRGRYALMVRYSGYMLYQDSLFIDGDTDNIQISLKPVAIGLEEVVITSKAVNPAYRIVKNAIHNRNHNRMDKIEAYEYEAYTKLVISMDNMSQHFLDQLKLKQLRNTIEEVMADSLAGDSAKFKMAAFVSESVSRMFYKKPETRREEILAVKTTGMKGNEYNLLSTMFLQIDVYANNIQILDRQFVSPIADGAFLDYDYQLVSVEAYGRDTLFGIDIIPRSKWSMTFKGRMYIDNHDWALNRIDLSLNADPNINFVEDVRIRHEFQKTDSFWVPSVQDLEVNFQNSLFKRKGGNGVGLIGRTSSYMYDYKINQPREPRFYNQDVLELKIDAEDHDSLYWKQHRRTSLDQSEQLGIGLVDSLEKRGILQNYLDKIYIFTYGTKEIKYVDLGPWWYLLGTNRAEGIRSRIGLYTLDEFSKRLFIGAHLAYGTRDQRFKYQVLAKYKLRVKPKIEVGVRSTYEVEQVGFEDFLTEGTSLFESSLRRVPLTWLNYYFENKVWAYADIRNGLSGEFYFRSKTFEPCATFPFYYNVAGGGLNRTYSISEIGADLRISFKEKYITTAGDRSYLGTKYPIINLSYSLGLKGVLGGDFNYHNISVKLHNVLKFGRYGKMYYTLAGGSIFGRLPYPELYVFRGNQTWAWRDVGFNMLNYYEFVADRYATLLLEYHLEGFLFNRIPLFRRLKWKEILGFRAGWGMLSQHNYLANLVAPDPSKGIPGNSIKAPSEYPYMEASAGIGNILKLFRVEGIWRINYLEPLKDHAVYKNWGPLNNLGLRIHMQVRF